MKRNRSLVFLFFVLVFHIVLMSSQVRSPTGTVLLKVWVLDIMSPFISKVEDTIAGINRIWRKYVYLKNLYDENLALKRENEALKLQLWKATEMASATHRLQDLLNIRDSVPLRAEGARIVIKSPSFFSRTIFLDKGSSNGIKVNLPVIGADGIVGRIIVVARGTSEVQLITNSNAAAGATVESSGAQGVVNGTGEATLALNHIRTEERVAVGDTVVTSGMDGIYPKGLPVGKVVEVKDGPSIFKSIKVEPSTDFSKVQEVLIILN